MRYQEHLAAVLLPLLSVFSLDSFVRDHPLPLSAARVAARAAGVDDGDEADTAQPLSLDALVRSPSASLVLVELLHSAQAVCELPVEELRAPALVSVRSQLPAAIDAALRALAALVDDVGAARPEGSQLLQDRTAHYVFKRILTGAERKSQRDGSVSPLSRLLAALLLPSLEASPVLLSSISASNRGCFVLLALAHALDEEQQRRLRRSAQRAAIATALQRIVDGTAEGGGPVTGCGLLLGWLGVEPTVGRGASAGSGSDPVARPVRVRASKRTVVAGV